MVVVGSGIMVTVVVDSILAGVPVGASNQDAARTAAALARLKKAVLSMVHGLQREGGN